MKKLLLPIVFLLMVLPAISQSYMTVQGTITDLSTGTPIANQAVIIHNDSVPSGNYFNHTVYTYSTGYYIDTIFITGGGTQGNLYVGTIDCQNFLQQQWFTYNPASMHFVADFAICYNSNPCQANFTYNQSTPLTVQFNDLSVGGNSMRNWDFGDGNTATGSYPVHVYTQPGSYYVTLTIGALGTTCYDTIGQWVQVWGNSGGGCQAAFYTVQDSTNLNMFHFFNQSSGNIFNYSWDFGDGGTSNQMNPSHVFSAPGLYSICLTVSGDSSCYDITCQTITVGSVGNCNAAFTAYPDSNAINTYHFADLSTSTGNIATWVWNFYDGTPPVTVVYPNNPNISHTFPGPGYYMVCLTITDASNTCTDVTCDTIIIGGASGCQANFYAYPDSLATNNTFQFVDLSLGNIVSWNWTFGDPASGLNNVSTAQNPVHIFSAPGTYNVCLTVQGDSLCSDTYCATIVVSGGTGCQANFDYSSIPASKTITFTDLSTGSPSGWFWSFGDGTSSAIQNPVHTYASAGTYDVTLTIFGPNCQSTVTKPVTINDTTNTHQVYGQVFAGNFPINQGFAMIFSLDTTANTWPYFAVCPLDSNGVYFFTLVPDGIYYIMAVPLEASGYLPTYYGNTISWELATLIALGTPNNPYNISLVATEQMIGGPGSVAGQVGMGDVSSAMLDKINMIIRNEQGNPIGFVHVASSGTFGFPSLAYGTYHLRPEMPGAVSDQVTVTLSAANPHAEIVMTYTGNSILGIRDQQGIVDNWRIYPNPVRDNVTIELAVKRDARVTVEISNMMGQTVTTVDAEVSGGNNSIRLNTGSMPEGVYTFRISSANGINLNGKLVKTR